ncbi:DUF418 domain-containing protein [Parasphingopyxis sp.]|uniref:DUF418 domain-containing protein n=1 Tax=Parasphingopyxis sp. TaxID=1920299 RepID=UPI002602A5C4|nr:DUF418 domain-containing protein [Parasphingopyxis sp.]
MNGAVRHMELDAVRGFAVMGIVLMNIFFFAMPSAAYFNPRAWGGMETPDLAAWALSFVFVEDKMRGLFLALFGASAMLVIERTRSRGGNGARRHWVRMGWLLVFGLAHAVLLANNDILRLYAITGLVLPLFANLSVRGLLIWTGALLCVHLAALGYLALNWLAAHRYVLDNPEEAQILTLQERMFGVDQSAIEAQHALFTGGYGDIVASRLANVEGPLIGLAAMLPITLAGMLLGVALLRSNMLTGGWDTARYRRWAVIGFVGGGIPLAMLAAWAFASDFAAVVIGANALVWSAPFDMLMTVGWAALLILTIRRFAESRLIARVAAAGRVALTNYIGASLVLGLIFYGWGLGLFGQIGRIEAYPFAFGTMVLMLLWSKPWLAHFRYGPLEWLWRSLSRGRVEKLRGAAA